MSKNDWQWKPSHSVFDLPVIHHVSTDVAVLYNGAASNHINIVGSMVVINMQNQITKKGLSVKLCFGFVSILNGIQDCQAFD